MKEPSENDSKVVNNEMIKLAATWLNGTSIASTTAGFVTPLAAVTFGVPGSAARGVIVTTMLAVLWLGVGLGLHLAARRLLRRLRA